MLQLSKYPALNNLERQTSIPKAYAVLGLGALYFFLIVFNLGGQLLTNIAGFVIPGYYSLGALFTSNKADDTQWLTVSGCDNSLSPMRHVLTAQSTGLCLRSSRKTHLRLCANTTKTNLRDSVLESLVSVVYWFPFYYTFKFVFLLWLSLPVFK